ncbi:MAG: YciI family protein [Pseudomonadota bacterium]
MPDWDTYKAEAQARGALALELFVVQSTPVQTPEVLKTNLPAHLAYQAKLEAEGTLVFAGPLSDETGMQMEGMGMIIYRAPSIDTARALADADPMHSSGARRYTLRKWMVNEGSLTVTVGLSGQSVVLS